jgi:hypothetical protein
MRHNTKEKNLYITDIGIYIPTKSSFSSDMSLFETHYFTFPLKKKVLRHNYLSSIFLKIDF